VRVQHLKAKGTLRHATVKQFISDEAIPKYPKHLVILAR
jgi:hypothetical protein